MLVSGLSMLDIKHKLSWLACADSVIQRAAFSSLSWPCYTEMLRCGTDNVEEEHVHIVTRNVTKMFGCACGSVCLSLEENAGSVR